MENIKKNLNNIFDRNNYTEMNYWTVNTTKIIDSEQFKAHAKNYYQNQIFKDRNPNSPTFEELSDEWKNYYSPSTEIQDTWYEKIREEITISELETTIKNSPRNKAPGDSGITFEIIRKLGPTTLHLILNIYNQILETTKVPKVLKKRSNDSTL
jgi:hypothetical protein